MSEGHQERRKPGTDRRSKARQGKYDRRKNRCGVCFFFDTRGHCQKLDEPMTAEDFACVHFTHVDGER